MKKGLKVVLVMLVIIVLTYAGAILMKLFGINEGWPTQIIPFAVMLTVTFIFARVIDKLTFAQLGLSFNARRIPETVLLLLFSGLPLLAGALLDKGAELSKPFDRDLLAFTPYYILVAFAEEFLYRGYFERLLNQSSAIKKALISALAFASFHFISPEFNFINFILLFIFGVIFMAMYLFVKNLWPLIFFHCGWDVLSEYSSSYQNVLLCFAGLLAVVFILFIQSRFKEQSCHAAIRKRNI